MQHLVWFPRYFCIYELILPQGCDFLFVHFNLFAADSFIYWPMFINSVDSDDIPHYAATDLGLNCCLFVTRIPN